MEEATRRGYTVAEACEYLATSRQTLYRLIDHGSLDSYHIGTRRYVTRDAMDRLIDERVATESLVEKEIKIEEKENAVR